MGSCSDASSPPPDKIRQTNQNIPVKRRRDIPLAKSPEEKRQTPRYRNPSSSKRKNKGNDQKSIATSSSSQRQDHDSQNAASNTTLVRRVQAVVHIKREDESDDDFAEDVSGAAKDEASEGEISRAIQRRSSRRNGNFIVDDVPDRNLRHRNGIINYQEDDEDEDDDDVDELMMGAEVHITWLFFIFYLSDFYTTSG